MATHRQNKHFEEAFQETLDAFSKNPSSALEMAQKALAIAEEYNYKRGMIRALNYVGICHAYKGDHQNAQAAFSRGLAIGLENNDPQTAARMLNNMGNIYLDSYRFDEALDSYRKSLEHNDKTDDTRFKTTILANIALVLYEQDEFDEAIDINREALDLSQKLDFKLKVAHCNNNLGLIYLKKKKIETALKHFKRSRELLIELNNMFDLPSIILNIGVALIELLRFDESMKYMEEALEIATEIDNVQIVSSAHLNIGKIYHNINEYEKAEEHLLECYRNLEHFDTLSIGEDVAHALAELYESMGQFDKAFQFIEKEIEYIRLRNREEHAQARVRYESERKERDAEIYRLKNVELNREIQTRERMLSIIGHDLKSPFSGVLYFLNEFSDRLAGSLDDETVSILLHLQQTTTTTYKLIDNLLEWARLRKGDILPNLQPVRLCESTDSVIATLQSQAHLKSIEILSTVDSKIIVQTDDQMLETVIRNLISNAIKFTEANNKIEVSTVLQGDDVGFCKITIADNGIGMDSKTLDCIFNTEQSFTTDGTRNERGTGLGLTVCKEFIELLGGTIAVESKAGEGSTFWFTLPICADESQIETVATSS